MLNILKVWKGQIIIDNVVYESCSDIPQDFNFDGVSSISLQSNEECRAGQAAEAAGIVYRVEVRQYMTKKASPAFDFMAKWNNDIPMPLRIMVGTYDKETPGMYHMNLHGDILEEKMQVCMKCGKPITNPVSQYFGMGPECSGHGYINPFNSDEELAEAVSNYKKELQNITWTGWVIKTAITSMEELNGRTNI